MTVSGLLESITLFLIMPLLSTLSNPNILLNNELISGVAVNLGFSQDQLVTVVAALFICAVLISSSIRIANIRFNGKIAAKIGTDLSCRAFKNIIYQPFQVNLNTNSSKAVSTITLQVDQAVTAINNVLIIITSLMITLSVAVTLIVVSWQSTLFSVFICVITYFIIVHTTRQNLLKNSQIVSRLNENQVKTVQETLGGIREIIMSNIQEKRLSDYKNVESLLRDKQASNKFISTFPRHAIEAVGLIVIAVIGLFLSQNGLTANLIPILGTLALGSQRLLPSMQQIYRGWATLKALYQPSINVFDMVEMPIDQRLVSKGEAKIFEFNERIQFLNVSFKYASGQYVIKDLNINIYKGECLGIIGSTGSGKSTFIDLLMGLLEPTKGKIFVDNKQLNCVDNDYKLNSWMKQIAHVPQLIYLSDDSLKKNIALGVPNKKIDMKQIYAAAECAQISDYIDSLPEKFDHSVGERGLRLSGGQKQRIGLARAFYRNSDFYIFDEATSALDNETEKRIISSIQSLNKSATVIMIAHRLSTLRNVDRVIKFEKGAIVLDGPPESVLN